ncbi:chromosome partitioning protein Smc [Actinoplanes sp. SE50]|uniref:chromosome segregation protein SMC n=1 Tax=unclassified Actinoplanes TaxID=2626549 RepID=UPI00023EDE81|nr:MULTISPECIES: chromosome segregation protein SMC [unclassified Actinoplanes]AEV88191.1 Chromosome partition protein smc [Actinoplanes sp. SE50/110]ATO86596.1 chromosome partitioning protein Smc [Actinoplanes sp. SE50]SLM04013.1 chromosome segregation protein SMC [Actinoplanes sp. SE50/110]
MHLKSLTVKGFKSFASATTLRLEPGITCVVGPNGSGKSNVVDAIAWVLGEQGAKALRGGKMEDVIFAGTAGRAPLGRAEVTLTIDNNDGALPIDYTEVSITRRMFRDGASEYEINGNSCRLLDIQELLSDSGIGREMHIIVGQGRLDAMLHAKPEDRRSFIEEAAGVLKHRKRKEKAVRKLDAMQVNLNRLNDLTAELRRQLKPLGRQAEVARRAAGIQADLRDARLRLLADDLFTLRTTLDREIADEAAMKDRRAEVEAENREVQRMLADLEFAHAEDAPLLQAAQDTWYKLSTLQERFRSTEQLATERLRHLAATPDDERPGRDPDMLEAEAERVREQEEELREALTDDQMRLAEAVEHRQDLERQLAAAEGELRAAAKAIADRREGLAKLVGNVNAARARTSSAAEEIERLAAAHEDALMRAEAAQAEVDVVAAESSDADRDNADLDARHDEAVAAHDKAAAVVRELSDAERAAEKDAASLKAREEALALGLKRKDGAGALLAKAGQVPGLLGSLASMLSVRPGYETALSAALDTLADAVALASLDEAVEAVRTLKIADAGRAALVIAAPAGPGMQGSLDALRPALPEGALWAPDVIDCPEQIRPALNRALRDVVLVPDLAAAATLIAGNAELRAVTPEGDVLGAWAAAGGSAKATSYIEVQAAVDEAKAGRAAAEERIAELKEQLSEVRAQVAELKQAVQVAAQAKRAAEGERNAAARRLAELGAAARSARAESERLGASRQKAEAAREADLMRVAELEERLRLAEDTPIDEEPSTEERDRLAALVPQARQNEMEVRLAVRTAEERVSSIAGRADSLLRQANQERQARERAAARRAARARGAEIARAVAAGAGTALARLTGSLVAAAETRDRIAHERTSREAELQEVRATAKRLVTELERLTSEVHRDEMARAEQRMRIEQLEVKAAEDFSLDVDTLITEYGPEQPVPPTQAEVAAAERDGKPAPEPVPFHRATQEKRANKAERDLTMLGKVNPLALEEFAALEERFKFLSDQLEDLKATRKDLLTVVKDVDDRILEVFTSAFEDTAREFQQVFQVLFPGGEGRLILTDPEDMLTTGVEVEARPPGKKIKRLSLLSGGERSLTAVAMLCAIFRARPSPFYIMDEVEAALDDVNLGRLITLFQQLREKSQLLIITHQKRTMEVADALYGVTMRAGVTQVISQRLNRDTED